MTNQQKARNRETREETLEAAMFELLASAERFREGAADEHNLANRRRVLLTAARSYVKALTAVERGGVGEDS